jgi:glycosyltransferase involved in cell wall biosynthesis
MRILFVSTSFPRDSGDWRGVFMRHLANALARVDGLSLSVWAPPGDIAPEARSATTPAEAEWLAKLMADGGIAHCMRSGGFDAIRRPLQLLRLLRQAYRREQDMDVYHINWLQTALPLPDNQKPALITVLGTDLKLLKLPLIKTMLRRVMRRRQVILCPNADWMRDPLEQAFGDAARIVPVVLGIDPVWYGIERRLDEAPPRWLAVTRLTRDKLGPLFDWSAPLFAGGARELHLFGPMQENIQVPDWVHYHGAATPEQLALEWFACAHGLITLSRHAEGRPQVMLEAMAAGLPIIASDMPAHSGLVSHGVTGLLCRDSASYADAFGQLEDAAINSAYGEASRSWVRGEIGTWDDCAERYAALYRQLMAGNHV